MSDCDVVLSSSFVRSFVRLFVRWFEFFHRHSSNVERTNERTNEHRTKKVTVSWHGDKAEPTSMHGRPFTTHCRCNLQWYLWLVWSYACLFFWILVVVVLACEFKLKPCRCCDERTGCRWLGWTKWQQMHPSLRYFSSQCAPLSAESRLNLVLGNHTASTATSVAQDSMHNSNFSPIGFYTVSGLN